MNTKHTSLTEVQQAAIDYLLRSTRPNERRVRRKAANLVNKFCLDRGYEDHQASQCVRDMFDMEKLERNAE